MDYLLKQRKVALIPQGSMRKTVHSEGYLLLLKQLKEARIRENLTQEAVAARLELTQSEVSKVERGERRLDVVELREWCHLGLRIPFQAFLREFERALSQGNSGTPPRKSERGTSR